MKNLLLILALFIVGCASSGELDQKMIDYENSIYEQYEAAPGYKSLVRVLTLLGLVNTYNFLPDTLLNSMQIKLLLKKD